MAKRTINELIAIDTPGGGSYPRLQAALREAREVLKEVAYHYRADRGAGQLLKKWDEHD